MQESSVISKWMQLIKMGIIKKDNFYLTKCCSRDESHMAKIFFRKAN